MDLRNKIKTKKRSNQMDSGDARQILVCRKLDDNDLRNSIQRANHFSIVDHTPSNLEYTPILEYSRASSASCKKRELINYHDLESYSGKEEGKISDCDDDMFNLQFSNVSHGENGQQPIHTSSQEDMQILMSSSQKNPNAFSSYTCKRRMAPEYGTPSKLIRIDNYSESNHSQSEHRDFENSLYEVKHMTSDEITQYLTKCNIPLQDLLKDRSECGDIKSIVHVFSRVCFSKLEEEKASVLATLRTTGFLKRKEILETSNLLRLEEDLKPKDYEFIINLLQLTEAFIVDPESSVDDVVTLLSIMKMIANNCVKDEKGKRHLISQIQSIFRQLEEKSKELEKKLNESEAQKQLKFLTDIEILPSFDSITAHETLNIESHQIDKPYRNAAEYLTRQFCLFREDFIRPLRKGIWDFIEFMNGNNKKFYSDHVRLYEGVNVTQPQCDMGQGVIWEIMFDVHKFRGINWEHCGFLQHGNLVCLYFYELDTMLYATIADRKVSDLKKGIVRIKCLNGAMILSLTTDLACVMLESKAFYTTYAHTLDALKSMAHHILLGYCHLPFEEHLVHQDKTIGEPNYMKLDDGISKRFSFQCLMKYGVGQTSHEKYDEIPVLDVMKWPSHISLGLDISQYMALQLALTKRLVLLQGPPGTGKTLIGLRIVECLLNNEKAWRGKGDNNCPILLVSYTNHALDQFLMGVLNMPVMVHIRDEAVVRVGSRSEEKNLERYNLKQHQFCRKSPFISETKRKLHYLRECITRYSENCKDALLGILHERFLYEEKYMEESLYNSLRSRDSPGPKNETMFILWLKLLERQKIKRNARHNAKWESYMHTIDDVISENEPGRVLDEDIDSEDDSEDDMCWNINIPKRIKWEMAISKFHLDDTLRSYQTVYHERHAILENICKMTTVNDCMSFEEVENVRNVWKLCLNDRWRLYRFWLQKHIHSCRKSITECHSQFQKLYDQYVKLRTWHNKQIFKRAMIVAMTTTGAARHVETLREVAPRIVVVEEAAQVPEQHILTSITDACEHLILIGDHKQLKPSYNDYELAKFHQCDTSLLERMVLSGFQYRQLQLQHRMRPEIANFLRPCIYKVLDDDVSVKNYREVKGIKSSVFFITHKKFENSDSKSKSHRNDHEATFIVQLYRYLRLQGYPASSITILSEYRDQVILMRKYVREVESSDTIKAIEKIEDQATSPVHSPRPFFSPTSPPSTSYSRSNNCMTNSKGVRITQVDNFQGEENDIILLSLVRSNRENKIGHVGTENRICVSLSRAKIGLFVIGNFKMMRAKSRLWEKIVTHAEKEGLIGKALELRCHQHTDQVMHVSCQADFSQVSEGVCEKKCEFHFEICGHVCERKCHADDPDHRRPCRKPCDRKCKHGHTCKKQCGERCGPCEKKVLKKRLCGHSVKVYCFENPDNAKCENRCSNILPCGHQCQKKCGQTCNGKECRELVEVVLKCVHGSKQNVACAFQNNVVCSKPCGVVLSCGHACKGTCTSCSEGRLHQPCQDKCKRILVCGHTCNMNCSNDCPPCNRRCEASCFHRGESGCRQQCGEPCTPCKEPCNWVCSLECPYQRSCSKLCYELCDRKRCDRPCQASIAKCGHKCIGLCGEPCPKLCRVCDNEKLTEIFFGTEDDPAARYVELPDCGHVFEYTSLDIWMGDECSDKSLAVGIKCCPLCKKPIRRSRRYGNIVKTSLQDVEKIKLKQLEPFCNESLIDIPSPLERSNAYRKLIEKRRQELLCIEDMFLGTSIWCLEVSSNLRNKIAKTKNPYVLKTLNQTLELLKNVQKKLNGCTSLCKEGPGLQDPPLMLKKKMIIDTFKRILNWIIIPRVGYSEQELSQYTEEVTRICLVTKLVILRRDIDIGPRSVTDNEEETLTKQLEHLQSPTTFTKDEIETAERTLDVLRGKIPASGVGVSMEEKLMVIKAMGFSQKGHWYKCRYGHIYAIGECGGAMEEAECPECSEKIGGERHRLREDNAVASEMDGATHAAWSEQANMGNYEIRF